MSELWDAHEIGPAKPVVASWYSRHVRDQFHEHTVADFFADLLRNILNPRTLPPHKVATSQKDHQ